MCYAYPYNIVITVLMELIKNVSFHELSLEIYLGILPYNLLTMRIVKKRRINTFDFDFHFDFDLGGPVGWLGLT